MNGLTSAVRCRTRLRSILVCASGRLCRRPAAGSLFGYSQRLAAAVVPVLLQEESDALQTSAVPRPGAIRLF